ncbi:MAG: YibE/F family protein [bacterium]|nr:YibE/F family protein [bacterium]
MIKRNQIINIALGLFLVGIVVFGSLNTAPALDSGAVEDNYSAEILQVVGSTDTSQTLEIRILDGPFADETRVFENDEVYSAYKRVFEVGDHVIVVLDSDRDISYVSDYKRTSQLLVLFALFILVALLVTGWQGFGALIGMGLSFVIIFKLILPLILEGHSPVLVTILGASLIIPITFYSSHGFSRKTFIAAFSTLLTLVVAGLLAAFFADYAHLSGLASEEVNFLKLGTASNLDFQGLILSGILISILGILDDITISQASIVQQLKLTKKNIKFPELFSRAMIVGKDHIASLVNTLILVYTGASLPLLLLFLDFGTDFQSVVNLEFMAEEIVRTLIGSIALILAVPITTLIAAFVSTKGVPAEKQGHFH